MPVRECKTDEGTAKIHYRRASYSEREKFQKQAMLGARLSQSMAEGIPDEDTTDMILQANKSALQLADELILKVEVDVMPEWVNGLAPKEFYLEYYYDDAMEFITGLMSSGVKQDKLEAIQTKN